MWRVANSLLNSVREYLRSNRNMCSEKIETTLGGGFLESGLAFCFLVGVFGLADDFTAFGGVIG